MGDFLLGRALNMKMRWSGCLKSYEIMEQKMRRFKQLLTEQSTKEILNDASNGILSLVDSGGVPYGVPMSYAYDGERSIYFHSAVKGHKMECIACGSRCSFCVVAQDLVVPAEFTSYFRSVIVKGTIKTVTDDEEIMKGLLLLCAKYSPGINPDSEISKCLSHVAVLCLDIDSMTGKEAIELVRKRMESEH